MKEFVTLTLGEQQFIFRALDLDQVEELEGQFEIAAGAAVGGHGTAQAMAAVAEIACASLKFKQPDITVARCRKLVTLATVETVMNAIRGFNELDGESDPNAVGNR
jgi:hypothetical protein